MSEENAGDAAIPLRRARARRGEGDRLRAEILEATERLLVETNDADKVSIRAVAEAVGVSPPSIYLHFADKAELMLTVCGDRFAEFDDVMVEAGADVDDPLEALIRKGRAYVRFGIEHPEHYRLLFMVRNTGDRKLDEIPAAASAFAHLLEDVERCISAGAIAPADSMLVATGLWTQVHGLTSLLISEPGFPWPDVDALVEHVIAVQSRGLAP